MTQIAWRVGIVAAAAALLLAGCQPDTTAGQATGTASAASVGGHRTCAPGQDLDKCPIVTDSRTTTTADTTTATTTAVQKATAPATKPPTVAEQQALESAQSYVDQQAFSKKGLLNQLTSSAGEGFNMADAEWAVARVHVDWNAEAVEAAKSYLQMGGFSRASLIEQLTSSAGDQFTRAQALYAVKKVGL